MVLRLPDSWSNWNLEMLVFEESGKPENPEKKPLGAKERTNIKFKPHMASTPGYEPPVQIGGRRAGSHHCPTLAPQYIFLTRPETFPGLKKGESSPSAIPFVSKGHI